VGSKREPPETKASAPKLSTLRRLHAACAEFDIDAISAALRWLVHHSQLDSDRDDAIIIGASSIAHLQHNLSAVKQGPLPQQVVDAINDAGETVRPHWPAYFFSL
jgi:aflatoxin B1 aldehyde reductase